MGYRENGVKDRAVAVILAATLSVGMVPSMALAQGAPDAGAAEAAASEAPAVSAYTATNAADDGAVLDPAKLPDGTYTVKLDATGNSGNKVTQAVPFDDAIASRGTVTVKDGVYTVSFDLQAVDIDGAPIYATDIQYYDMGAHVMTRADGTIRSIGGQGNLQPVTVDATQADGTSPKTVSFKLVNAPANSYEAIKAHLGGDADSLSFVALHFDWDSLAKAGDPDGVSKFDLTNEIATAKTIRQGQQADFDFQLLQKQIAAAQEAADDAAATQDGVDNAIKNLLAAVDRFNGVTNYDYEAEHFYTVPVQWYGESGSLTSSLRSYFDDGRNVDVYYDGTQYTLYLTLKVKNDAIGGITYGAQNVKADLVGEDTDAKTRTYALTVADPTKGVPFTIEGAGVGGAGKAGTLLLNTPNSAALASPFADVADSDWFFNSVVKARLGNLMNGYAGTELFGPNDATTRAMAATVLYNYARADATGAPASGFSDVADGEWYTGPIAWAKANGVVNGYAGTDLFGPNDAVTREQFAAILFNYAGVQESDVKDVDATLAKYDDAAQVDDWAKAPVAWAVQQGLMGKNTGANTVNPLDDITRAEMAAMVTDLTVQQGGKPGEPGVEIVDGVSYTVPMTFSADGQSMGGTIVSSAEKYLGTQATVVRENGTYTVTIDGLEKSSGISAITIGGKQAQVTTNGDRNTFVVSGLTSLDGKQDISMTIAAMGGSGFSFQVAFDLSKAVVVPGQGSQLEIGKPYAVPVSYSAPGDPQEQTIIYFANKYLGNTSTVTLEADGTYTVVITGAEKSASILEETIDGVTATITTEGNVATFTFKGLKSLDGPLPISENVLGTHRTFQIEFDLSKAVAK